MKQIIAVFFILILSQSLCFAKNIEIKDVILKNSGRIDKETILLYSGVTIGEELDEMKLSDIIRNLYETEYFSSIKITFDDGILNFDLKENPIINNIYLDGSNLISYDQIKNELKTKSRGVYTKYKIKNDIDLIKSVYQKYGYISVVVEPKVVILPDNRVDIVFEIDEGEVARVKYVNIYGNNKIDYDKLIELIPIEQKMKYNPFSKGGKYEQDKVDTAKDNIINFYKENGYIDIKIEYFITQYARDSSDVSVEIHITEGEQFAIRNVIIDVPNIKIENITTIQKAGKIYNYILSKKDIFAIKEELYHQGYGYLDVTENIENRTDNKVDLIYKTNNSDIKNIVSIVINGNKKTRDYIIRRELLFAEGSTLIPRDLHRSENRLRSLGYFKKIEIKHIPKNAKDTVIYVDVEEEDRRGTLNFSAGYSTFEGKVLSYGVSMFNVFGKGYDFNTSFTTSKIQQSFDIGLHTMRFGDSRFGGGLDFGFSKFDATPYGVNFTNASKYIAPSISYRIDDNLFHTITYSYRKDEMNRSPLSNDKYLRTLLNDQFISSETSSIRNDIFYDTRDNFVLPKIGNRLGVGQTIAGFGGSQKFFKHDIELTTYQQWIGKQYTTMVSFHGGNVQSYDNTDVLYFNRYPVWFYNMRGFDYGGIGPRLVETTQSGSQYIDVLSYRGNTYGIFTLEQHFPMPFASDTGAVWYLFSDFATLYDFDGRSRTVNRLGNTEEIYQSHMIRNASGIGIAIPTPILGVIRLDYSAYIRKDRYDSTQQFRISLGGMPMM